MVAVRVLRSSVDVEAPRGVVREAWQRLGLEPALPRRGEPSPTARFTTLEPGWTRLDVEVGRAPRGLAGRAASLLRLDQRRLDHAVGRFRSRVEKGQR